MFICVKSDEVNEIIEKLEEIEENFWLQYKSRSKCNRDFLEDSFNDLYHKLYELIEGKKLELNFKENDNA